MIHIVTGYSRTPKFLERAYESIKKLDIDYHWYIVTTGSKNHVDVSKYKNTTLITKPGHMAMHTGVSHYYDVVPDTGQWVYALDDDNLIHPNFPVVVPATNNPNCDMIAVGQLYKDKQGVIKERILNTLWDIAIQKIDNGQFLVRRRAVGGLRYWPIYRGDGYFATEMRIVTYESGRHIEVIPQIASYYNAQTELFP